MSDELFMWPALQGVPSAPSVPVDTSVRAAREIEADAATLRRKVLEHVRSCGPFGATDEEIQRALYMAGNTERPRRWELQRCRAVRDSGMRRKTVSGRLAVVWVESGPEQD